MESVEARNGGLAGVAQPEGQHSPGGRRSRIEIPGEAFFSRLGSPDFLAYPLDVERWDDGEKLMNETQEQAVQAFLEAAKASGVVVEQEPYLPLGAG